MGRSLAVKALLGDRDTSDGNFVVAESAGDRKDCYPVDFEFAGTSDSIDVVEKILDLCLVSGEESPYRRPEDIPVFGFSRSEVNGYLREVADEIDADELRRKFGSDDRLDYDSGIKSGNGIASTIYRNITSAQY